MKIKKITVQLDDGTVDHAFDHGVEAGYDLGTHVSDNFDFLLNFIGYRKQSEWISVEERLPDNGETVLTVDNEGYMIVASWYELGGWFLPVCRANPVTHWMTLPEPPKGDAS